MKIRITAFCLLCAGVFLMSATASFGQLTKVWENHYVSRSDSNLVYINDGSVYGNKLQFDGSGNCYFLNEIIPPSTDVTVRMYHPQMQIIKYSPSGSTLWIHKDSFANPGNCSYCGIYPYPYQMIVNNDGSVYNLADYNNWTPYYQQYLGSVNANGANNWNIIGFGNQSDANMTEDNKGNIGVVATSNVIDGYGPATITVSKVTSTGNLLSTKDHSSPDGFAQYAHPKIATDKAGNFYTITITGNMYVTPATRNVWLTKFDTSGTFLWEKKIDSGIEFMQPPDILYNTTDSCIYGSYALITDTSFNRAAKLTKITTSGVVQWSKSITTVNGFTRLKQDKQGNTYLWSGDQDYGQLPYPDKTNEEDIIKYNSAGTELGHMYGNSFDMDASGYTYTTNYFYDSRKYQILDRIRKYSPAGSLLYEVPTIITGDNYTSEVYLNNSTNLYSLKAYAYDTISVTKYNATCSATAAPAKPKTITGSAVMTCGGSTSYAYSIAAVAKATYYNWTVPAGVTIDSGQGTNKIYVVNNSTFKTGTISVYAANCYGASAAISKAVNDTLKIPGAITGPASVCKGQTYVQYNVAAVAGANDYEWTLPANASIVCGNHTNSICVSFGNKGGTLTVIAYNSCGTASPVRSKQIKVTACMAGMTVEAEENKATIYPNPSSGAFTLRLGNTGKNYNQSAISVMVKDVSGKVVEEIKSVTTGSVSFGSRLVPGVYFVEVITGSEKQVLKVVKE